MQTGQLTNIVTVASEDMPFFKVGQKVMIYGASTTDTAQGTDNLSVAVARVGFTTPDGNGDETEFAYRVAQMDFTTGKISAATDALGLEADLAKWDIFNEGFDYKGTWASGVRYKVNDVVKFGANTWIATQYHTSAANFATDSAKRK